MRETKRIDKDMFSGIVEERAQLLAIKRGESGQVVIKSALDHSETKIGDSIAINGVCLTLVKKEDDRFYFDISEETIRRSTFAKLKSPAFVNLERALQLGERLHGHLVYGHVDDVSRLISRRSCGESVRLEWSIPDQLNCYLVEKGSVALDGVSLTVAEVGDDSFSVYIIPHTLNCTTLADVQVGSEANLEVDMLARYVKANMLGSNLDRSVGITEDFLKEHGYLND